MGQESSHRLLTVNGEYNGAPMTDVVPEKESASLKRTRNGMLTVDLSVVVYDRLLVMVHGSLSRDIDRIVVPPVADAEACKNVVVVDPAQ